eukprot:TRINITY_DN71229_c0_g1_i1.p2 TRINITY_DN71229_c0_g1~~TRINITY_DN71229_c0_g1_i1.p2  ORF type:complete len:200 (+),score=53.37 TRINITY_DN71229_c0_g1_i1:92-691(+)
MTMSMSMFDCGFACRPSTSSDTVRVDISFDEDEVVSAADDETTFLQDVWVEEAKRKKETDEARRCALAEVQRQLAIKAEAFSEDKASGSMLSLHLFTIHENLDDEAEVMSLGELCIVDEPRQPCSGNEDLLMCGALVASKDNGEAFPSFGDEITTEKLPTCNNKGDPSPSKGKTERKVGMSRFFKGRSVFRMLAGLAGA